MKKGEPSARRDSGMRRSLEHANQKIPTWGDRAYDALVVALKDPMFDVPFLAEEMRDFLYKHHGIPLPPDERAWGSVFNRAGRRGVLRRAGTGTAKSSNLSPKPLWARGAP